MLTLIMWTPTKRAVNNSETDGSAAVVAKLD